MKLLGWEPILALTLSVQPLADEDCLEPSIQNEVDHALSIAPTNAPPVDAAFAATDPLGTNALSKTAIAIALVSAQGGEGRWMAGTNDVTRLAVEILEGL